MHRRRRHPRRPLPARPGRGLRTPEPPRTQRRRRPRPPRHRQASRDDAMSDRPAPLHDILRHAPVIAILRGLAPEEAADTALALHQAGIRLIEVPLNGARATETIARLAAAAPPASWIGAGTVVDWRDVAALP